MGTIRVVDIEADLHRDFKMYCAGNGISMTQKIIALMREELDSDDRAQLAQAFGKGLKKVSKK
jgi:hypothetical protein